LERTQALDFRPRGRDMWKALIAGTAASVIAGSSLLFAQQPPAPAAAVLTEEERGQDNGWQPSAEDDQDDNGWQPSAEDISAFMDARIAALKAGLRLTPDQEKNWPAFESAVRDMAKARADRWAMRQNEQPPADPVEWLQRRADALGKAAVGLKKLADAEGPLYKSLDDAQKHRFEFLARGLRPHRYFAQWKRSGWNGGRGRDQNCGWRHPHTDL
ncbi:MAG: Spy/CpxP family protein refolding chaperone, partial [Methyloceanibacter sp.]